ncbi:MAG: signal recognition particle protein [Oscillospiraceae bacterium]|nr:signal recognition particle protein [Oscillospiraceae bacterium]MBQ6493966.1 signal recognition particle protein [Erysipelotrichaceae bacterium]
MFDSLQEKLTKTLRNVQGKGKLSERNMEETLKEIRVALLESDVNYKVVKDFLEKIRQESIGHDVLNAVEPGQLLVKIVHDEIINLLGDEDNSLNFADEGLTSIMVVGLQGTGKTTQVAKLANLLKKQGRKPIMIAGDIIRPAAIEQLQTLGKQIDTEVYSEGTDVPVLTQISNGIEYAKKNGYDTALIDTAGRLQIDEELMQELKDIKDMIEPQEILLTVDALTGQDIVNVANAFNELLQVTGLILTKFDGDSKGGAALSVKAVTGVPIKFTGVGEKISDIETFHPERLAQRILGMGDIVSFVEKAQEEMDMKKAEETASHLMDGKFTMDDLLNSIEQSRKIGPLSSIIKMMPGMSDMANAINDADADAELKRIRAIIQSMTPEERNDPSIMRSSHKRRIAKGSGTTVDQVNKLCNQYDKMKKLFKNMSSMKSLFRM